MFGVLATERAEFALKHRGQTDCFDRLALLIYGTRLSTIDQLAPRRDGVIEGGDFLLSSSEVPTSADDDARRIAIFHSRLSPYSLDPSSSAVQVDGEPTGLRLESFPYRRYAGPAFTYYLRSDRTGRYSRLVLNPHANCFSRCKWCARTYEGHARPDQIAVPSITRFQLDPRALRQLPAAVTPVRDLVDLVSQDPQVVGRTGDLSGITEVAVLSGDFPANMSASSYLIELLTSLAAIGFGGTFYYAGHQVEERDDMERLASLGLPVTFVYTVEHFTRRPELMPVKGKRSLPEISAILRSANEVFGRENVYYYLIIGIDPIDSLRRQMTEWKELATPQAFVLTPYNFTHERMYHHEYLIERMRLILQAREFMLDLYGRPIPGGSNRSLFPLTSISN